MPKKREQGSPPKDAERRDEGGEEREREDEALPDLHDGWAEVRPRKSDPPEE